MADPNETVTISSPQPNPRYWSTNGTSIIACVEHNLYKIDKPAALLNKLTFLPATGVSGYQCVQFPDEWQVTSKDFEVLLEHAQGTEPPLETSSTSFEYIASLLRISAPDSIDLPSIHSFARQRLESLIPKTPTPFFKFADAASAIAFSIRYNVPSIQKHLYYTLVTTTDIGAEEDTMDDDAYHSSVVKRCKHLFRSLIDHFTPILFTVSTASHMGCTDVFAENWMTLVVGPAFSDDGVSQPIETLQRISDIDWRSFGLCEECLAEKKAEWRGEIDVIWEKIDGWLTEA